MRLVRVLPFLAALLAGGYLLAEWRVAGGWGFPLDDAWIHMVFARNLARGCGLAYNCGQPVAGSTAPLWTGLIAPFARLPVGEAVLAVKALGVLFLALLVWQTARVAHLLAPGRAAPLLAGLLVATAPGLLHASVSGMEPILFAWLVLLGVEVHLRVRLRPGPRRLLRPLLFALATLARPEGAPLVVWCWLDEAADLRQQGVDRAAALRWGRWTAAEAAVFLAALSPYFVFNVITAGSLFPNTFAAKVGSSSLAATLLTGNVPQVGSALASALAHLLGVGGALLANLLGAVQFAPLAIRRGRLRDNSVWLALFLIGSPLLTALVAPDPQLAGLAGNYQLQRYMLYLVPLAALAAALGWARSRRPRLSAWALLLVGAGWLGVLTLLTAGAPSFEGQATHVDFVRLFWAFAVSAVGWLALRIVWGRSRRPAVSKRRVLVAGLAVGVLVAAAVLGMAAHDATRFGLQVRNINSMHVAVGRWLAQNTAPQAELGLNDIGAIAYFADRPLVDLEGLVTPDILPYLQRTPELGAARDAALADYFDRRGWPDYLALFPTWHPELAANPRLQPVFEVALEDNVIAGGSRMVVYRVQP